VTETNLIGIITSFALLMLVLGAGCDESGDAGASAEEAEIEAAVRSAFEAWNNKDLEGVLAALTDNFMMEEFEFESREQAREFLPEYMGFPQFVITDVSNIEVSGDTASAEVLQEADSVLTRDREHLVRVEGVWKLDREEDLAAEIPDGTTTVDMTFRDFTFDFDASGITSGNVAFSLSNAGSQPHNISLSRVPDDFDIEGTLLSQEDAPEVVEIGGSDTVDPRQDGTMVFVEPLEPGRYMLICVVGDDGGGYHYEQGMFGEFTVP
jgi:hypothetical protein